MPNHCINEVIFRDADAATVAKILSLTCGPDEKVDFQILIPIPANVWRGNIGIRHEKTFRRTILDWARENWGTKWNAYDHHPIESAEGVLTLRFDTAWGPPYGWLCALHNTLKLRFEHNWLSEGGAPAVCGIFDFSKMDDDWGEPWLETVADEVMQRHLHLLLWGVEVFPDEPDDEEAA